MKDILLNKNSEDIDEIPDNSVDLIASDCPYGLKFMQKDWDKTLPSVKALRQSYRVLKPDAFAFW